MKKRLFKNREEWRSWLRDNHSTETELWLVYYKKHSNKKSVSYDHAVEEALCFGWIDSVVRRIDDEKYMQRFTPRKDKSIWAKSNKERVAKLIRSKKMTKAGLAKIEAAKKNGWWNRLDTIDQKFEIPKELLQALAKDPKAEKNFAAFAPSHQKQYCYWVISAKKKETQERRIEQVVARARDNIKPGI